MGFEDIMILDARKKGFGSQRYLLCGKERPHVSKSGVAAHDASEPFALGDAKTVKYAGWKGKRYLTFESLGYELVVTLYDVNSPGAYAIRVFDRKDLVKHLQKGLRSIMTERPNIEARIWGLQNKEDHAFLGELVEFLLKEGIRLIEADLFGEEIRHIALDLKTGTSYNLLLEDRHYRPGELANPITVDDFRRSITKPEKART